MGGWMDGWMDGRESGVKDCLQQSKTLFECKSLLGKKHYFALFGLYRKELQWGSIRGPAPKIFETWFLSSQF
jgi:hypothetical protein